MNKEQLKSLLITKDKNIKDAMEAMCHIGKTAAKILFVVDKEDVLVGTVTDGDIRRGLLKGLSFNDNIETITFRKFTSVNHNTPNLLEHVKRLMKKTKIEQIPVVNDRGVILDVFLLIDLFEANKIKVKKKKLPNQVVIMAGGKGMRLDPFTQILPKPLIPVGNKAVIEKIMENFDRCGFSNFVYTLNYKKEFIKLFLSDNNFPYNIGWVEEEEFLGTAGGLSLLKDRIKDTFFVVNCDSMLDADFRRILKWHKDHKSSITIIGCHSEIKIPFGVLQLSEGKFNKILEKPVHDMIINTGVYLMEPHVLSYVPQSTHMDMNHLIEIASEKENICVFPIYDGWLDIGQWKEYKESVEKIERFNNV
jgi:dTDP-glucose pyrophosphorylase/predicted transcriptional regulator